MKKDGRYAGEPELFVLARMYGVKIAVHRADDTKVVFHEQPGDTAECVWHLICKDIHFKCLVVSQACSWKAGRACNVLLE